MLKHVYEETRYLTRKNLLEILGIINYVNPKKEEILSNYGVDIKNVDLDDIEAYIKIDNYLKDISIIFKYLNLSILDDERLDTKDKERLLNSLKDLKINLEQSNLIKLRNLFDKIKDNDDIINDINKSNINFRSLKEIINNHGIKCGDEEICDLLKVINGIVYKSPIFLPTTRDKFYDENNNLISIIEAEDTKRNETNLKYFEGEIYEKLDFKTDEEANNYVKKINSKIEETKRLKDLGYGRFKEITVKPHEIREKFDQDFKTYMHFKGELKGEDWYDEIHIFKQDTGIMIKFGGLVPIDLKVPKTSITNEEIDSIILEMNRKCPINEVSRYAIRELRNLKKVIDERKYIKKNDIIDKETLIKISSILANENYGNERNIYFKTKIISSNELNFTNEKIKTLNK